MTSTERGRLLRAIVAALAGLAVGAALHVVAAYCSRSYAASLEPFAALRIYSVQVIGFAVAVFVGGAVAGLFGGKWGGLGGALVGLASGTGIREAIFGWLVVFVPSWPQAPTAAGFSIDTNTALLVATTAHLSTRRAAAAVAYAIVWIAAVTYVGWAGAALARWAAARRGGVAPRRGLSA